MAYDRYLDIHLLDNWDTATFSADVHGQQQHQEGKIGAASYKMMKLPGLTINRKIALPEYQTLIDWVCKGTKSKIRINAHGNNTDGNLYDGNGVKIEPQRLAEFLMANGLAPGQPGGLKTVNVAACSAASGGEKTKWIIAKLADALKLPGVAFTGAPREVKMNNGVLQVKSSTGKPVDFKHNPLVKKTYTYASTP
jgi:hypothetical protein